MTIVAEAAQGFEGDPTLARMLVRAAAVGRADLVKFQLVFADELATPAYRHHSLFRQLEMPEAAWETVAAEAARRGVGLVFDVYGPASLRLAAKLGAQVVKVHSTDFFNQSLIDEALAEMPRVFFSAGGIEVDEVAALLGRVGRDAERLTLLYGFQSEPTATADNHLRRLAAYRHRFPGLALGFMDHADGASDEAGWLGLLALPFGISVLEKHISLDRGLELEDYVSAVDAAGFARYVERVRAAEAALGCDDLTLSPAERAYRGRALKVVVAARPLAAGAALGDDDVALLRTGLEGERRPLHRLGDALGRRLRRPLPTGAAVYAEDLV